VNFIMAKIQKPSRSVVWIFGAGASRGAGSYVSVQRGGKIPIPVQNDFWRTVLRFSSTEDRRKIESFLFRYFNGYRRTPAKVKDKQRRNLFDKVDVEEVFTFLSERTSTSTISQNLKVYFQDVWVALIRSVAITFRKFNFNVKTRAVYSEFCKNHLRSRDAIISFNYDLVLENSIAKSKWYYFGIGVGEIPIFKPHGSINWSEKKSRELKISNQELLPVIVAPSHLKFIGLKDSPQIISSGYLNNNPTITKIWQQMEERMRRAKVLVFIGYSFPNADLYFSSVLRTVLTNSSRKIKIVIVNPDAQLIAEKLKRRFSIEGDNISSHFTFETFCKLIRTDVI
jgi:hypothetical protein